MSEPIFKDRLLIDYLPNVLNEVREYFAVMYAEQPEVWGIWSEIGRTLNNQFAMYADEYGISRWEHMMGITPLPNITLEERRFAVMARLNEQLPYTIRMLHRMLSILCGENGYEVNLQHGDFTITVRVALTAVHNFEEIGRMLNRVIPANLIYYVEIKYNQHITLQPYTHAQLNARTHYQLRNEVLP